MLVAPRAYSPLSGESVRLVDLVNEELYSETRSVRIVGFGKSTALANLAAEFHANDRIRFLDGQRPNNVQDWDLTVFSHSAKCGADVELRLVLWGQDEIIEYLMARSPARCKSVMARIMQSDDLWLGNGSPQVLSVILEAMIDSDEIMSVEDAILFYFDSLEVPESRKKQICNLCINRLFNSEFIGESLSKMVPQILSRATIRFLCNQTVRYALAAREVGDVKFELLSEEGIRAGETARARMTFTTPEITASGLFN